MATFQCSNEDCSYSLFVHKVKFKNVSGHLQPDINLICPDCGNSLVQEDTGVKADEVSVGHNRFQSLNDKDKKEVIKKRAKKHFKKYEEAEVKTKRQATIQSIKEQFSRPKL